jgi:hypothetical protein
VDLARRSLPARFAPPRRDGITAAKRDQGW